MTTSEEFDDPFLQHFRREPLTDAGIRIIALIEGSPDGAEANVAPLVDYLGSVGRTAETRIIAITEEGVAVALAGGLAGAHLPLVLVTTAEEPWTADHVKPLLEAIDHCDHVVGRRPVGGWERCRRWLATLPRRLVFSVPLRDIHSPCRLHRL